LLLLPPPTTPCARRAITEIKFDVEFFVTEGRGGEEEKEK